ncbi:hypothetical protein [Pseudothermotoga sp.]
MVRPWRSLVFLTSLLVVSTCIIYATEPLSFYIQEYYKAQGKYPKPPSWVGVGTIFVYGFQVGVGTRGVEGFTSQGYKIQIVVGIDTQSNYVAGLELTILSDIRGNVDFSTKLSQIQFVELRSLEVFLSQLARTVPAGVQIQGGYLAGGEFYFAYSSEDYQGVTRYDYTFSKEGALVSGGFLERSGTSSSVGKMELLTVKSVELGSGRLSEEILRVNPSYQVVQVEQMTGMVMAQFQIDVTFNRRLSEGFYGFLLTSSSGYSTSQAQVLGTELIGPAYINPSLLKGEILSIPEIGLRWIVEGQGQMGGVQTAFYVQGVRVAVYEYDRNGVLLQYARKTHQGYEQARRVR